MQKMCIKLLLDMKNSFIASKDYTKVEGKNASIDYFHFNKLVIGINYIFTYESTRFNFKNNS
jgi:hypothetical protein